MAKDDLPVIPQITLENALLCAQEMALTKGFGTLRKVSGTRYEAVSGDRKLFMQTPEDPANVYSPFAFRPVMADPKGCLMPEHAYRIGYVNVHDPKERLIGYVWSDGKSRSIRREWKYAVLPKEY